MPRAVPVTPWICVLSPSMTSRPGTCCSASCYYFFFFSSRRRHTRSTRDWSSDVYSSDLRLLRQRPALQVREDEPGHGGVVGDQVTLGETALGEEHLVPVGELQPAPAGQHHEQIGRASCRKECRSRGAPEHHNERKRKRMR